MRALVLVLLCVPGFFSTQAHAQTEGPPKVGRSPWPQPTLGASSSGAPEVLFTFDDGPEDDTTDRVLDTLREHDVRALFFVVARRVAGSVPRSREIIQRMLDERHAVGNHTWNHLDLCLRENRDKLDVELDGSARAIRQQSRMGIAFFRAPYGARCGFLERALEERGLWNLHWDIDPQEWRSHDGATTAGIIIAKIKQLADGERAVVLIHDTHASTAIALPMILEWLAGENRRRIDAGRRPVHVLEPADVAVEKLAPGVAAALEATSATLLDFVPELGRRFLDPLSPPMAKAGL